MKTNARSTAIFRVAIVAFPLFVLLALLLPAAGSSRLRTVIAQPEPNLTQRKNPATNYWSWQPAPPSMQLHLTAALSLRNGAEMAKLKQELQQPGSPLFHQWLTTAEFARRFGPTADQMTTATNWLKANGFSIESADLRTRQVRFSGSVAQVRQALGIKFVSSGSQFANLNDPAVPASLAGSVTAFLGLNNLNSRDQGTAEAGAGQPQFRFPSSTATPHFAPRDFWTFYGESDPTQSGANGGTQAPDCIGLLEYSALPVVPSPAPTPAVPSGCTRTPAPTDTDIGIVNIFSNTFCLPAPQIQFVYTTPTAFATPGQPSDNEPNLDADWAHAAAPDTPIKMYIANNPLSNTPALDTLVAAVNDANLCGVISSSVDDRGAADSGMPCPSTGLIQVYEDVEAQAVIQGQTVFHSSGDFGSNYVCGQPGNTSGPTAKQPSIEESFASSDVTVVGGTQFSPSYVWYDSNDDANTMLAPNIEQVWQFATPLPSPVATPTNGSGLKGASGGGISTLIPVPSWQASIVPTGMSTPLPMRGVPDVSIAASGDYPGYWIATTSTVLAKSGQQCPNNTSTCFASVGGTSASSPIWAGISRLIAQNLNNRLLGNINPFVYQLGANKSPALVDVSVPGNNCSVDYQTGQCTTPAGMSSPVYQVGPGYDLGTGLGSPDIDKLVTAFADFQPSPTPTGTPTPGAQATSSPVNSSGGPGATVDGGSVTISNTSSSGESITSLTVSVSNPGLFGQMSLTGGGQTITVTSVASSTVFTFSPPITVAAGSLATFDLSAIIAGSTASLPAAYAGFGATPHWLRHHASAGALPLAAGLMLISLTLGAWIPNRRRIMLTALLAVALCATLAGCGGSSSSSSPGSTQELGTAAIYNSQGTVTVSGLPAKLGVITKR